MTVKKSNDPTEKQLDAFLDTYTIPPASQELHAKIVSAASIQKSELRQPAPGIFQELLHAMGGWRIAVPVLALSLIMGFTVNLWTKEMLGADQGVTIWELSMLSIEQEYHQ